MRISSTDQSCIEQMPISYPIILLVQKLVTAELIQLVVVLILVFITVKPTYIEPGYNEFPHISNFFSGPLDFPMLVHAIHPAYIEPRYIKFPPISNEIFGPLVVKPPTYNEFSREKPLFDQHFTNSCICAKYRSYLHQSCVLNGSFY